jgi:hypothetical protein
MSTRSAQVRVFVAARGNAFMVDIADWIVDAARATGRSALLVRDDLPRVDGATNLVVAPHEFFELFDATPGELQRAAAASICIGTEQPGTPWFQLSLDASRRGPICFDINPHGVAAARSAGLDCRHLQLGATPSMSFDVTRRPSAHRRLDALFLGGLDPRRGAILADLGARLERTAYELRLFKFDRPVHDGAPGLVFGTDKYRLLADTKLLINLHRQRSDSDEAPYFEWARMVEAMSNGAVVVTEPSQGFEPLIAGTHFVECAPADMADVVTELLTSPERIETIAAAAWHAVRDLGLAGTLGSLLDDVEATVLPRLDTHVTTTHDNARRTVGPDRPWRLGASKVVPPVRLPVFRPFRHVQRRAKQLALDEIMLRRKIDRASSVARHGSDDHLDVIDTPAFAAHPAVDVSVVVTLYNYGHVVDETLASVVASEGVNYELIVVDDASTDDGAAVVEQFVDRHPDHPIRLIRRSVNLGLAHARNLGFEQARARLVMVLDADNHLYPTCLRQLADALDRQSDAAAAYGILEDFGGDRNIRSALPWDPARMVHANYIDAQAMVRRAAWRQLGGYCTDERQLYGWEDWDFWLRLAASGGHAVLVPRLLGRYRVQEQSMISLTNLDTDTALAAVQARSPGLPWPTPLAR